MSVHFVHLALGYALLPFRGDPSSVHFPLLHNLRHFQHIAALLVAGHLIEFNPLGGVGDAGEDDGHFDGFAHHVLDVEVVPRIVGDATACFERSS